MDNDLVTCTIDAKNRKYYFRNGKRISNTEGQKYYVKPKSSVQSVEERKYLEKKLRQDIRKGIKVQMLNDGMMNMIDKLKTDFTDLEQKFNNEREEKKGGKRNVVELLRSISNLGEGIVGLNNHAEFIEDKIRGYEETIRALNEENDKLRGEVMTINDDMRNRSIERIRERSELRHSIEMKNIEIDSLKSKLEIASI
jgi:chromosome segregation ATPase